MVEGGSIELVLYEATTLARRVQFPNSYTHIYAMARIFMKFIGEASSLPNSYTHIYEMFAFNMTWSIVSGVCVGMVEDGSWLAGAMLVEDGSWVDVKHEMYTEKKVTINRQNVQWKLKHIVLTYILFSNRWLYKK